MTECGRMVPGGGPDLDIDKLTVMERHARTVSYRFGKPGTQDDNVPWREELRQVAWEAMLVAARTWDPLEAGATPFSAYVWQAAVNACHRAAFCRWAPVMTKHRVTNLKGLRGVEPTTTAGTQHRGAQTGERTAEERELTDVAALNGHNRPDHIYEEAEFEHRVRDRIEALVGEAGLPFAYGVLTGEFKPAEIAAHHNVPVTRVYALRDRVKQILEQDAALYALWKEKTR